MPTPELAEIRADESASWRNFIPELTHAPAPSQRRNAAPSEVEAQLKQLFRQLSLLFADSAGVPVFVRERTRWDAAMAVAAGEIHFLGFGSAMARDPLAHAPQANAATFPSGGYEEFTFTPIGGRRAYQPEADAQQPSYGSGYGGAPANNDYSSARTTAAAAQWSTPPQGAGGSAEHLTPFIDSFRDVLTDPVTIIVAFGWLMLWLFLETVQWGPGRRRRRG